MSYFVVILAAPVVQKRLIDRYNAGSEKEKAIRRELGELDEIYIANIDKRYAKLKEDGWFDHFLRTDESDVSGTVDDLLRIVVSFFFHCFLFFYGLIAFYLLVCFFIFSF